MIYHFNDSRQKLFPSWDIFSLMLDTDPNIFNFHGRRERTMGLFTQPDRICIYIALKYFPYQMFVNGSVESSLPSSSRVI